MLRSLRHALSTFATLVPCVLFTASAHAADPAKDKGKEDEKPGLRLSVEPSADGPWKMVLKNEGETPMRILADGRLLSFEVVPAPLDPGDVKDPKKPVKRKVGAKPKGFPRGKIASCKMPTEMRPESGSPERAIVLPPGEAYEETFDPVAYCGATKLAGELGRGAVIYPTLGYSEVKAPKHPKKSKDGKTEEWVPPPPYLAESLTDPPSAPPLRQLKGDGAVVPPTEKELAALLPKTDDASATKDDSTKADAKKGDATQGEPKKDDAKTASDSKSDKTIAERESDPMLVDERAPRVAVKTVPRADAEAASDIALPITVTNVGKRSTLLHLRNDDVAFDVETPRGRHIRCNQEAEQRGVARDFFESLGEGKHRAMTVRLEEICPTGTFGRPGVYVVVPRLALHQAGDQYHLSAYVGSAKVETPVKIRVRKGPLPYFWSKPVLVAAAPPPVDDDDAPDPPSE